MTRLALLVGVASLAPAGAATYVGSVACRSCHPAQFEGQSKSGHAYSLRRAAEHPLARRFTPGDPLVRRSKFRFEFLPGFRVRVTDGRRSAEAVIEWAFGAGDQAVTFVSQLDEDRYLEHHFSYYSASQDWAATPGHADLPARHVTEAMGAVYRTFDPDPKIMRCFQCHSTGSLALGPNFELKPFEAGVRCEACHGPGSLHAASGDPKRIDNPGRLSAARQNEFCGECHRKPAPPGAGTDWTDPWNVRHQPLYLPRSRCFQRSRGALACVTCHDPHAPLARNNPVHYDKQCRRCHDQKPHPAVAAKIENCARCHMPAVPAGPRLRFTNHWIGVYREAALLTPVR